MLLSSNACSKLDFLNFVTFFSFAMYIISPTDSTVVLIHLLLYQRRNSSHTALILSLWEYALLFSLLGYRLSRRHKKTKISFFLIIKSNHLLHTFPMEIGTNIYLSKISTDTRPNNNAIKVWVSEQVSLLD